MCNIIRGYCLEILEITVFKKELALILHYFCYSLISIAFLRIFFKTEYCFNTLWVYFIYLKHKTYVGDIFDYTVYIYLAADMFEYFLDNGNV